MRFLLDIALVILIATVTGFSTAWLAVEHGHPFGDVIVGSWAAWPSAGGPDADPYSVALLARTGEVPLGAGEGLAFTATQDSNGDLLSGRCDYMIEGQTPPARLWTLTVYDGEGRLMNNAARRAGFHSREIVRHADGGMEITVSPSVKPGDWLPVARVAELRFVLRLYDTPLTTATEFTGIDMPTITRGACE